MHSGVDVARPTKCWFELTPVLNSFVEVAVSCACGGDEIAFPRSFDHRFGRVGQTQWSTLVEVAQGVKGGIEVAVVVLDKGVFLIEGLFASVSCLSGYLWLLVERLGRAGVEEALVSHSGLQLAVVLQLGIHCLGRESALFLVLLLKEIELGTLRGLSFEGHRAEYGLLHGLSLLLGSLEILWIILHGWHLGSLEILRVILHGWHHLLLLLNDWLRNRASHGGIMCHLLSLQGVCGLLGDASLQHCRGVGFRCHTVSIDLLANLPLHLLGDRVVISLFILDKKRVLFRMFLHSF